MSDLLFGVVRTIGSGLAAQRKKMEAVASNIANAETTKAADGKPYRKKMVRIFEKRDIESVSVQSAEPAIPLRTTSTHHIGRSEIVAQEMATKEQPLIEAEVVEAEAEKVRWVYDPNHPDANQDGYVAYPDINPVEEMVDLMAATRAYEANIAAMDAFKSMIEKALEI